MNKIDCEIYLAMNEDGGWVVVNDESDALSQLAEVKGGYQGRVVKVTVKMTPPVMSEASVTVGDEVGEVSAVA